MRFSFSISDLTVVWVDFFTTMPEPFLPTYVYPVVSFLRISLVVTSMPAHLHMNLICLIFRSHAFLKSRPLSVDTRIELFVLGRYASQSLLNSSSFFGVNCRNFGYILASLYLNTMASGVFLPVHVIRSWIVTIGFPPLPKRQDMLLGTRTRLFGYVFLLIADWSIERRQDMHSSYPSIL